MVFRGSSYLEGFCAQNGSEGGGGEKSGGLGGVGHVAHRRHRIANLKIKRFLAKMISIWQYCTFLDEEKWFIFLGVRISYVARQKVCQ